MSVPIQRAIEGDFELALKDIARRYTGYDPDTGLWSIEHLKYGILPLAAGLLVHKFVGGWPLNANKMLAAAGVPYIRI